MGLSLREQHGSGDRSARGQSALVGTQSSMADEDEYVDSFVMGDDNQLLSAIQQREAACAPLLKPMGGNPKQALQLALADPPYATKTEAVKVRWAVALALTWRTEAPRGVQ